MAERKWTGSLVLVASLSASGLVVASPNALDVRFVWWSCVALATVSLLLAGFIAMRRSRSRE